MRNQGGTLQQAFAESGVFAADDVGMVASGEKAGAVPETLGRLADYQADAADSARSTGRMIGTHGLILFIIITSGYFAIMAEKGYFDFVFDATKLLGLE
jgi:type II secretory pathway component PulF